MDVTVVIRKSESTTNLLATVSMYEDPGQWYEFFRTHSIKFTTALSGDDQFDVIKRHFGATGRGRRVTPPAAHNRFVSDSKGKEPDVLFVGDSLIQLMHEFEVWRKLFSPLHSLNFGIGGDATQHVLWRLSNGELDHICPKVVVLWVGTNNHGHTPEQICGGIMAIINVINKHLPQTHILVLGVLPRGKSPNPLRERNAQVNTLVQAELASLSYTSFLDLDPGFVQSDGSISHQDMYDYLHLTAQAYQKVCQPIYTRVKALLDAHAP